MSFVLRWLVCLLCKISCSVLCWAYSAILSWSSFSSAILSDFYGEAGFLIGFADIVVGFGWAKFIFILQFLEGVNMRFSKNKKNLVRLSRGAFDRSFFFFFFRGGGRGFFFCVKQAFSSSHSRLGDNFCSNHKSSAGASNKFVYFRGFCPSKVFDREIQHFLSSS